MFPSIEEGRQAAVGVAGLDRRRQVGLRFSVKIRATGKSPAAGAEYRAGWSVRVPSAGIEVSIEPWLADQEIDATFAYWEGAVRLEGTVQGQGVTGQCFVELKGYARSMQGVF